MRAGGWVRGILAVCLLAAACSSGGSRDQGSPADVPDPDRVEPTDLPGSDDADAPDIREIFTVDYGPIDPGQDLAADIPGEGGDDAALDADAARDAPDEDTDAPDLPPDGADADAADVPDVTDPGTDTFDDRFGDPCTTNDDCPSGWCVQTDAGKVCSRECVETACPDDWSCRPVVAPDGLPTFLCVPRTLNLCRPCTSVFDCRTGAFPMAGLRCVALGEWEGSFCLPACGTDAECPADTTCAMPLAGDAKVCLPSSGSCACSSFAVETVASTPCARSQGGSTCLGERTCIATGLTTCDAPVPATEACGGGDEDCDGQADEENAMGCVPHYRDADRDGYGIEGDSRCLCAATGAYVALKAGDCDDRNPATHPDAAEECNGRDDDCDGSTDGEGAAGCAMRYPNLDGDGYGADAGAKCLCAPTASLPADLGGDCDDDDPAVFPGSPERCNGKDDSCDGSTDEDGAIGCQTAYEDVDADGYGLAASFQCKCTAAAPFTATSIGDCDDRDGGVFPGAPEACNGKDDNCDTRVDEDGAAGCEPWYLDGDLDAWGLDGTGRCLCRSTPPWSTTAAGDCNDALFAVHPLATEECNLRDDDCDDLTDEENAAGCTNWYVDGDGDGYGDPATAKCLCGAEVGRVSVGGDCDDTAPFVNPGALDACGNGVDDNCDGQIDGLGCSGCVTYYQDADGDAHGVTGDSKCLEAPDPVGKYTAPVGGDCDDAVPAIHPGAVEACNGVDDNCDGVTDGDGSSGCTVFYLDTDVDRFGVTGESRCLCAAVGRYTATAGGDCDDTDRAVNPGRAESCNGRDDDCDGLTDEIGAVGCLDHFRDADGDTYGDPLTAKCLCGPEGQWTTKVGGDCNDKDVTIRPGATEKCNGKDDNCSGQTDEMGATGCVPWYLDGDGDGYGLNGQSRCLCAAEGPYRAPFGGDCADDDAKRSPGAMELCDNVVDDDCDGLVDEEMALGCAYLYRDIDGDDYGISSDSRCLCAVDGFYRGHYPEDCDDTSALVSPGSPERCGGGDEDCDGQIDEEGALECASWFRDRDIDGYGVDGTEKCLCGALGELRAAAGADCNDADPNIHPTAEEICNGRDDDCNANTDDPGARGCLKFYVDEDRDGFGIAGTETCLCIPAAPQDARIPGDCDDTRGGVFPGGLEACNGLDDDCNGLTDEGASSGCVVYYRDHDGDLFGDTADSKCLCVPTADYAITVGGDCNDFDALVKPGQAETCDGRDNDCNGVTDDPGSTGCKDRYKDGDRDGFGVAGQTECLCEPKAPWDATKIGDCNDNDAGVYPTATEVCNGKDDNCDGVTDPDMTGGCTVFYMDRDGDGWGLSSSSKCMCAADGLYRVLQAGDCDDNNVKIYPGAAETCNSKDDDCDGATDEENAGGCKLFYRDSDGDSFGWTNDSRCLCSGSGKHTTRVAMDCCDEDASVHPGQMTFFTVTNKCGAWDYDCSGKNEQQTLAGSGGCSDWSDCDLTPGWAGAAPGCGDTGVFLNRGCGHCCLFWTCCCDPEGYTLKQACR